MLIWIAYTTIQYLLRLTITTWPLWYINTWSIYGFGFTPANFPPFFPSTSGRHWSQWCWAYFLHVFIAPINWKGSYWSLLLDCLHGLKSLNLQWTQRRPWICLMICSMTASTEHLWSWANSPYCKLATLSLWVGFQIRVPCGAWQLIEPSSESGNDLDGDKRILGKE